MYIISSFEHSTNLELAISELEQKSVPRESILAVPLDKNTEAHKIFDSINYSDGISLFDSASIIGAAFMVLGAIYGYILKWGPIIWGLIGLILGTSIGFAIELLSEKRHNKKKAIKGRSSEVILMISCEKSQADLIKKVLWDNFAIGVGSLDR